MKRIIRFVLICFLLLCSSPALANSSWHWITYSPREVLPFAILITLIVEVLSISQFGKVTTLKRTIIVVTIANMISYIVPYIERAMRFMHVAGGFLNAWSKAYDSGPYYLIMSGYLVLTLIAEIPIVYYLLRSYSINRKHLLYAVISSNIVTTIVVFAIERLISQGSW